MVNSIKGPNAFLPFFAFPDTNSKCPSCSMDCGDQIHTLEALNDDGTYIELFSNFVSYNQGLPDTNMLDLYSDLMTDIGEHELRLTVSMAAYPEKQLEIDFVVNLTPCEVINFMPTNTITEINYPLCSGNIVRPIDYISEPDCEYELVVDVVKSFGDDYGTFVTSGQDEDGGYYIAIDTCDPTYSGGYGISVVATLWGIIPGETWIAAQDANTILMLNVVNMCPTADLCPTEVAGEPYSNAEMCTTDDMLNCVLAPSLL